MVKKIDLILHKLRELFYIDRDDPITIKNLPERLVLKDISIAIDKGKVIDIDSAENIEKKYKTLKKIKCEDLVATPGFIDAHTHIVFAGSREDEWEAKVLGANYIEIAKKGGGILNTVNKTREASINDLLNNTKYLLDNCFKNGTTTVEIKSGYGLNFNDEIKILQVIKKVKTQTPIKIVPTLLAAHAIPPEFKNNKSKYVKLITEKIIPHCAQNNLAEFCDIFVEEGFFNIEDAKKILTVAKRYKMNLKMHIDEFTHTGAVDLALQLGVTSLEHLVKTSLDDAEKLSNSKIICVLLPTTYFNTKSEFFNYGKLLWEKGCKIALGTDANPGTSMCFSMVDVVRLATTIYKVPIYVSLLWATANSKYAIGEKNSGRIAKDLSANILLWRAPSIKYIFYTSGLQLLKYIISGNRIYKF